MDEFETNLISMMVEQTMNCTHVEYIKSRSCYKLSILGYLVEIPCNWGELIDLGEGSLSLPSELISMLNAEVGQNFSEIKIIASADSTYSLEMEYKKHPFEYISDAA